MRRVIVDVYANNDHQLHYTASLIYFKGVYRRYTSLQAGEFGVQGLVELIPNYPRTRCPTSLLEYQMFNHTLGLVTTAYKFAT